MRNVNSKETSKGKMIVIFQVVFFIVMLLAYLQLINYPNKLAWSGDALSILYNMKKWHISLIIGGFMVLFVLLITYIITTSILVRGKHASHPYAVPMVLLIFASLIIGGIFIDTEIITLYQNCKEDIAQIENGTLLSAKVMFIDSVTNKPYEVEAVPGVYSSKAVKPLLRVRTFSCDENKPVTFFSNNYFEEMYPSLDRIPQLKPNESAIVIAEDPSSPKYILEYTKHFHILNSLKKVE